jgi:addiction module HigA family antidote
MSDKTRDETAPVTPGEILAEEFLAEFGLSQAALARALGISPNHMADIVHNRRRISADTALRLGLFFSTTPEFWQNLQARYDMQIAQRALSPEESERIVARRVIVR